MKSIGKSKGLFHRLRAPTLSPTLHHREPPPSRASAREAARQESAKDRGEERHQLARRLFFANQGAFQTGDDEEIMNKASCLSLLSNAALVWNTMHMTRIIAQLRAAGETITDDELGRVSPIAFAHIIPIGNNLPSRVDNLRPLQYSTPTVSHT